MKKKIFSVHVKVSVPGFSIPSLWTHSMTTASVARAIAVKEAQERSGIQDAFMGGCSMTLEDWCRQRTFQMVADRPSHWPQRCRKDNESMDQMKVHEEVLHGRVLNIGLGTRLQVQIAGM
jgi:hypothetical protein